MNAQEAAERAAEAIRDKVADERYVRTQYIVDRILAEFAPLLATKDAEIAGLIRDAAGIMEERDRLAADNAELKARLERIAIDGKYD